MMDTIKRVSLNETINDVIDSVYVIAIPKRKSYMERVLNYYDIKGEFIDIQIMKDTFYLDDRIDKKKTFFSGRTIRYTINCTY